MASITVKVRGVKELSARLDSTKMAAKYGFLSAAAQSVAILRGTIGITYTQNQPPSLRYIRTHRMEEGWTNEVKSFDTGVNAIMSNPVSYAGDVIGPGTQTDLFAGRWPTTRDILEDRKDTIIGLFGKVVGDLVERFGK